ncbi:hypothetical protein N7489_005094 [Penicillium chrysogenum]|uniref:C2H2-type domain-containing protein n=1 Tax=Penicillium chrysogenum TaxID=5076 RepID=A0ABQ8WDU3_PENCH|nr:uncharacterized protein N7489_005094 [Penicillium chrysogenum]KAJ5244998.1 hypothetical protein N7489_005094 [Penicillium chrysogenum]KAJ5264807.1 hypothetical protein N7505_007600 [Penicillium chrysogenum]
MDKQVARLIQVPSTVDRDLVSVGSDLYLSAGQPPPGHLDYVPSFEETCLFPNQANINSPYPRPLEALRHDSQDDVAGPCQAFEQPVSFLYSSQDPSNLSLGGSQSNIPRRQFKCGVQGCKSHFKLRKTLNRHLASHSGERSHVCWVPRCQRSFLRRDNLKHTMQRTGNVRAAIAMWLP